jgi:hypothetical protein
MRHWLTRPKSMTERSLIRMLHLVLSVPIIGFIYGPVAHIPPAADFTRFIAVPMVAASGIWLWQKPRFLRWARQRSADQSFFTEGNEGNEVRKNRGCYFCYQR